MNKGVVERNQNAGKAIEQALISGDLALLSEEQRVNYYITLCQSLGLNNLTKPFEYIRLNGKLVLYATKACAEQLRSKHGVSIEDIKIETSDDYCKVIAKAKDKTGRTDAALAVVSLIGLKGSDRANAEMKCETKAKRRVTLSICGLGMLDETEVETIKDAVKVPTAEDVMSGVAEPLVYTVPWGKFKGKKIEEIPLDELKNYMRWIRYEADRKNESIQGVVKEFLELADLYVEEQARFADFDRKVK